MNFIPVLIAGILAFLITAVLGLWLIPMLRKLKFGQTILEIGPRWHKNKQGTPTMGGILFVIGILVAAITGFIMIQINASSLSAETSSTGKILLGLAMALAFGAVGFIDDYVKVVKKQNEGLTEKQKLVMQFIITIAYVIGLYLAGDRSTIVEIPFLGQFNFGFFYYPIVVLGIIYLINAVNFTDGVDGLLASVTLMIAVGLLVISTILQATGMQMLSAALAGGCLGFLVWNIYPAKVFMGDTGAFFLGGIVVAIIFGLQLPAFLILVGMVYLIEGVTVIIQRYYFKYTRKKYGEGRRIFKMTPIHHHFEMSGWSENKIVMVFSMVQLVFCGLAVLAVIMIIR